MWLFENLEIRNSSIYVTLTEDKNPVPVISNNDTVKTITCMTKCCLDIIVLKVAMVSGIKHSYEVSLLLTYRIPVLLGHRSQVSTNVNLTQ